LTGYVMGHGHEPAPDPFHCSEFDSAKARRRLYYSNGQIRVGYPDFKSWVGAATRGSQDVGPKNARPPFAAFGGKRDFLQRGVRAMGESAVRKSRATSVFFDAGRNTRSCGKPGFSFGPKPCGDGENMLTAKEKNLVGPPPSGGPIALAMVFGGSQTKEWSAQNTECAAGPNVFLTRLIRLGMLGEVRFFFAAFSGFAGKLKFGFNWVVEGGDLQKNPHSAGPFLEFIRARRGTVGSFWI